MIIRIATEEDLPEILGLYAQLEIDNQQVLEIQAAQAIFARMKSYPDYHVYVAEKDGEIVGTFALAILDNLAHRGSKSGLIENVAVTVSLQGHGIGREIERE